MSATLLALDFDGVVWDSAGECYHTALDAYDELYGVRPEVSAERFREARWLARTGHDFGVILQIQMKQPQVNWEEFSKGEFALIKDSQPEFCERFNEVFYRLRSVKRDSDFEGWASSQRPYPEFVSQVPALIEAFGQVAIATTKDEASARKLLASADFDFPILGKEFSTDKALQMAELQRRFSVQPDRIVFVDDLIDNLERVRTTGARVALADWGYNVPAERQHAVQQGIPVVGLEGLREHLLALL